MLRVKYSKCNYFVFFSSTQNIAKPIIQILGTIHSYTYSNHGNTKPFQFPFSTNTICNVNFCLFTYIILNAKHIKVRTDWMRFFVSLFKIHVEHGNKDDGKRERCVVNCVYNNFEGILEDLE